jgi:thiosulfate dehydrogenase [quinone] large subunit
MSVTTSAATEQSIEAHQGSWLTRGCIALLRVGLAFLWIQNVGWKAPPDFGESDKGGLYHFTRFAVDEPVVAPYAWFIEHVVLPNFTFFGWLTLLTEAALGAFLLIGLATRFWAVVGVIQSLAITLSVLNAPHEWHWSYYLMILAHIAVFATAAGRSFGVDGVLRPRWLPSTSPIARVYARLS